MKISKKNTNAIIIILATIFIIVSLIITLSIVYFSYYDLVNHQNSRNPYPWDYVSQFIGWIYFFAWSVSFYPQMFMNYERKSVHGLSLDFIILNMTGFIFYSFFNFCLLFVEVVKDEYREMHHGANAEVTLNDLFFSCHAGAVSFITLLQCYIYHKDDDSKLSFPALFLLSGFILAATVLAELALFKYIKWLLFLNVVSTFKLIISVCKYLPQMYLNYKRKSTEGWNIHNILLDLTGGTLSFAQLFIDCISTSIMHSIFIYFV